MRSRRQARTLGLTVGLLAALCLACNCGPDTPRPPGECAEASVGPTIDRLEVTVNFEVGFQGTAMLALYPRWVGANTPECADARWSVSNPAGEEVYSGSSIVQTELMGGTRTPNGLIFVPASPPDPCGHTFRFESHGEVVQGEVGVLRGGCGDGGPGDAGVTDGGADAAAADAGLDAGDRDAGVDAGANDAGDDAGVNDAGASDAGASDAGSSDAGSSDAGSSDAGAGDAGIDAAAS